MSTKFAFLVSLIWLPYVAGQSRPLQDPSTLSIVSSPVLGFVFDSAAHGLRPIAGIPGASLLGQPLDLGFDVADAAVSPQQDYILALAGDTRAVFLLRFQRGDLSVRLLDGVAPSPDRMALSPSGNTAALYYAAAGVIQLLTGLPDAPALAQPIDASSLNGQLGPLVVSDDGQALLVATAADAGSLTLLGPDGGATQLPVPGPVTALAFRPRAHDALVASRNNQVLLIRDLTGNTRYQLVATQDDGVAWPVAVTFLREGSRVFVANADTGDIAAFDLAGGPPDRISCRCAPTGLHRLNGPAVFRLNELSATPLLLLDGGSTALRVLFVPTDASAGPQGSDR